MMRAFSCFRWLGAGLGSILLSSTLLGDLASVEAVSRSRAPQPQSGGDTFSITLSADGQWAVLVSSASGLATNDHNGATLDLFLKNIASGETTLLTRGLEGEGADGDSHAPWISADGRWIVFESEASNLADGDSNEASDIFTYDRQTGEIRSISQTADTGAEGEAALLDVSRDGRFVVFTSTAGDLAENDANEAEDVFIWARETGETRLVTGAWNAERPAAAAPFGVFVEAAVSADGRFVAHTGIPRDLIPNVPASLTNEAQLFLWDRTTGTNRMISQDLLNPGQREVLTIGYPVFSGDGGKLAFLVENRTRLLPRCLWVYTLASGELEQVPAPFSASTPPEWAEPAFNLDGSALAFVYGDQVAVFDAAAGASTVLSRTAEGAHGSFQSASPQISDDGQIVVFTSHATNLVAADGLGNLQVLMLDRATTNIVLLSRAYAGGAGANADAFFPVLSGNGKVAGFSSAADNLLPADNRRANDVFLVDLASTNLALASAAHAGALSATANESSRLDSSALSLDGRYVVFLSFATDLAPGDTNASQDAFIRDLRSGEVRKVNEPVEGATGSTFSTLGGISANGRIVYYTATEAFPGTNVMALVAYDTLTQARMIASILPNGTYAPGVISASISADGRHLLFVSGQVGTGTPYVRDLQEGTTRPVSGSATASAALSPSGRFVLVSASGNAVQLYDRDNPTPLPPAIIRNVTAAVTPFAMDEQSLYLLGTGTAPLLYQFSTATLASNVVATNAEAPVIVTPDGATAIYRQRTAEGTNVVVLDMASGQVRPLLIEGEPVSRIRQAAGATGDGRYVAFAKADDWDGTEPVFNQIYLYDLWLTNATLLSRSILGGAANGPSGSPSLSADGRTVVFDSLASDLVANDRNEVSDVFVARLTAADANNDGLEDGWAARFLPPGASANTDSDGDGATNLQEFLAGTDPTSAASVFAVDPAWPVAGMVELQWNAVPGRTYQLQNRIPIDDGVWNDFGPPVVAVRSRASAPAGAFGKTGFYRVVLLPNPQPE
jgi:Tol biopolymer transport system component